MRSVQTQQHVPLSQIKPLEALKRYRAYCLDAARRASEGSTIRRDRSPVTGAALQPFGAVDGLAYLRCPDTGSLFLAQLPPAAAWARLLAEVSAHRRAPGVLHTELAAERAATVTAPKIQWILDALRLQEVVRPHVLEAATLPSGVTELLQRSGACASVEAVDETALALDLLAGPTAQAVLLLESLDRSHDPEALLRAASARLAPGGVLFVTALVASGFDIAVLGVKNAYLYPPDRANCFSLSGLKRLLTQAGFDLLEVSTPGVLDVEIVRAHAEQDPSLPLSAFERQLMIADAETQDAFQSFLQQQGLSSYARIVARKQG
jgi:hypothetical protein